MNEDEFRKLSFKDRFSKQAEAAVEFLGRFIAQVVEFMLEVLAVGLYCTKLVLAGILTVVFTLTILGALATPFIYLAKFF